MTGPGPLRSEWCCSFWALHGLHVNRTWGHHCQIIENKNSAKMGGRRGAESDGVSEVHFQLVLFGPAWEWIMDLYSF